MKKISYLFAFFMIIASCSKELTQAPSDSLPVEDIITTVDNLGKALNGVYATFVSQFSYAGDMGLYADGRGGDVQMRDLSFNHFQPLVIFQTDANSKHSDGFYRIQYTASARVNNILSKIDGITDVEDNKDQYNDYLGQLYAIRALIHFEIARMFAQLPTLASDMNAEQSGIVLNDTVYQLGTKSSRSTLKKTYDFIVNDFNRALPLLGKEKVKASGKINHWAAKALLARVNLYLGNYNQALALAHDVINNSGYELYTRDNFLTVWVKKGTSESMFELLTTDITNAQRNSIGYYTSPEGYPECSASDDFATWLSAQTNDIRAQSIKWQEHEKYKAYYTIKYEGQEGASTPLYVNNFKVIRLAEMYLIAAEAKFKNGTASGSNSAVWYYNELRKKRIAPYTDATSITLDDILNERRREFFCENHRMYDLVRNKRDIVGHPHMGEVKYNSNKILMAIPQREIDISGGNIKQNPN